MKFYKYWARGEAKVQHRRPWTLRAYGGSNQDLEQAIRRANEIATRAASAIQEGRSPGKYGYADRSLREEIIQEINDSSGLSAVITRNSYGALVLNTSRVMFADVDYPPPPGVLTVIKNIWDRIRGKPTATLPDRDERLLRRFKEVVDVQPGLGLRIYRTAAGYRLLATSNTYDPLAAPTDELLALFGSDTLYVRLCKVQECFRARLSAKYWRCGVARPPARLPWADADEERRYRQWEELYHAKANQFAVCELVGHFGNPNVHEDVQPLLDTHDRLTIQPGAVLA